MTKDEALKHAKRVLINLGSALGNTDPQPWRDAWQDAVAAHKAIDAALAEQEQEPCGWQLFHDGKWRNGKETHNYREHIEAAGIPTRNVYPEPQPAPAVPEPVQQLLNEMIDLLPYNSPDYWIGRIREVLSTPQPAPAVHKRVRELECVIADLTAQLKEAQQPAQAVQPCNHRLADARNKHVASGYVCIDCGALFAAADHSAPSVQPLTDEQIIEIAATPAAIPGTYIYSVVRAIEAAHGIGAPKE